MNTDKYEDNIEQEEEKSIYEEILSWIFTILFAVVLAYFITHVIIVNAIIPSASMENTIMTNDRVIANRLEYTFGTAERYDIAVFKFPDSPKILYIKRVIGLPGETVEIRNNEIYINGGNEPLEDSFINGEMFTKDIVFRVPKAGDNISDFAENIYDVSIYDKDNDGLFDEDCFFMMGDNRNNSADSRVWLNKYVPESFLQGKAIFRYYPLNKMKVIKNDFLQKEM